MDTGDMLLQGSLPITDVDNTGTMFEKLAVLGGELLIQTLDGLKQGIIQPVKQNEAEATHAARILKEDEVIDWTKPADVIFCQIRGLAPAPGAYTIWNDQRLKIWKSRVNPKETGKAPGTLVEIGKDYLLVQTGKGCLEILELQPAGKKAMPAKAFCNGTGVEAGVQFGELNG